MKTHLHILILLALGVVSTMIGDVFLKRSDGLARPIAFAIGFVFYSLGALPVAMAFKRKDFSAIFVIWEALTIILAIAIGHWMFKENIGAAKIVAVILSICALILYVR